MKKPVAVVVPLLCVAAAAGWWWSRRDAAVVAAQFSGTVEARQVLVGSRVGGRVTAVAIEEGRQVRAGEVLVRFDVSELEAQRRQVDARAREAEAQLDKLRRGFRPEEREQAEAAARQQAAQLEALVHGPRAQEIAQAQADLAAAEADLRNANTALDRVTALAASGDLARQSLDDAKARQSVAAARAEAVRQRVALLHAGSRAEDIAAQRARSEQAAAQARLTRSGYQAEDIAAAQARLSQMEAQRAELDVRIAEGEVRAPADALAEVVSVRPGDLVPAGRAVVTLLEPSALWVRVFVPEPRLAAIAVGQAAQVEAASSPGRWFRAHVEQIAAQGEFLPRNVQTRDDREHLVYAVKVRIDEPGHGLKSGMAVNARIPR